MEYVPVSLYFQPPSSSKLYVPLLGATAPTLVSSTYLLAALVGVNKEDKEDINNVEADKKVSKEEKIICGSPPLVIGNRCYLSH